MQAPQQLEPADSAARWWLRQADIVRGPFAWETIVTNFYLGRLQADDEVSLDQQEWLNLPVTIEQPPSPRLTRRAPPDGGVSPRLTARVQQRRAQSARVWAGLRTLPRTSLAPLMFIVLVLTAVTLLSLLQGRSPPPTVSCDSALGPAMTIDFCNKAGIHAAGQNLRGLAARNATLTGAHLSGADLTRADLSYAELTGADLSLADLSGARLLGANLRNTSLGHASLRDADLRYADFTAAHLTGADLHGADLDHAIWTDGRICRRTSKGECR